MSDLSYGDEEMLESERLDMQRRPEAGERETIREMDAAGMACIHGRLLADPDNSCCLLSQARSWLLYLSEPRDLDDVSEWARQADAILDRLEGARHPEAGET